MTAYVCEECGLFGDDFVREAHVGHHVSAVEGDEPEVNQETPNGPPFVILEHLTVGGFETVRVLGIAHDEMKAHDVATAAADVGLRVWLVDLWGSDNEGPTISRYVGQPGAAYLHGVGMSSVQAGAGETLTEKGL